MIDGAYNDLKSSVHSERSSFERSLGLISFVDSNVPFSPII